MRKFIFAIIFLSVTAIFSEKTEPGFYMKISSPVRINPLAAGLSLMGYYRFPLISENGRLWESTHFDAGLINNINPAYESVMGYVNIEPIAIFDITVTGGYLWAYNIFGYGITRLPYSSSATDHKSIDGYKRGKFDREFSWKVAPRLKLAFGQIIFAHTFTYNSFDFSTVDSEFIYDLTLDVRRKKTDVVLENSTYLLYKFNENIIAGANFYHIYVPSLSWQSYRLSVLFIYEYKFTPHYEFLSVVMAGPYLKHENYSFFVFISPSLIFRF